MDERTILVILFGSGCLLQSMMMLRAPINFWTFLLCLGGAAFGMLPGKREEIYEPLRHILFCFGLYAVFFAAAFKKELLPSLSERSVLSFTAIFWFAYLTLVFDNTTFDRIVLFALALPTLGLLGMVFGFVSLRSRWQVATYAWFLTLVVALSLMHYSFGELRLFDPGRPIPWMTPIDAGLAGMACAALLINATFFAMLWPIPRRGQSWSERKAEWLDYLSLLDERFSDTRSPIMYTLCLVVLVIASLVAVRATRWMQPGPAIHLAIVLTMLLQARDRDVPPRPGV